MKIRNSKSVSIDDVQLIASRGAILHPDLLVAFLNELTEMEHQKKICRVPSAIFEHYHNTLSQKFLAIEGCQHYASIVSSR